jgi:hypothetical protein
LGFCIRLSTGPFVSMKDTVVATPVLAAHGYGRIGAWALVCSFSRRRHPPQSDEEIAEKGNEERGKRGVWVWAWAEQKRCSTAAGSHGHVCQPVRMQREGRVVVAISMHEA